MADFAAFETRASAAPVTAPEKLKYAVKAVTSSVISAPHIHFISFAALSRAGLSRAAEATAAAMYA